MPRQPRTSEHLSLEIAAAFTRGRPLEPGEPVPGCSCVRCQVHGLGGGEADVEEASLAVVVLAGLPVDDRVAEARRWAEERKRCGRELSLPSPGVLSILAAREPGAVRCPSNDSGASSAIATSTLEWERQVDAARGSAILDVVRRHVGEPVKRGRAWLVSCPFHEDALPSLSIEPDKGLWFCFPCAFGGDGIELVMRLHRVTFVEAVKELAA